VTAEFEARPFIDKLKAIDGLRDKDGLHPGTGTMLFYGPPGTGKTALARYLADALGKDVIIKRASDIMNCFVGETEKNIAKAFSEAEAEDAVLVIDEADSFLYSRDMAVRSWETSFVNEFLTTLEECRCFMVATSNRRENMDPAAMRRFSFKIQFRYAGARELVALYLALLAPLIGSEPDKIFLSNLSREKNIAPGDFHAVRCRNRIGLPKDASHYDLLRELIMERDLKLEKGITRIGF
jgi:SpoVK/Ycf46/Vps4 family AAA+-type ATPase